jgi:hypothetical protein
VWATCPRSASSGYHAEFHERYHQKHTNLLNCRTNSSDISGYYIEFHEGQCTVGECQGRGMEWQGNDITAAWARYGMCELAFKESQLLGPCAELGAYYRNVQLPRYKNV